MSFPLNLPEITAFTEQIVGRIAINCFLTIEQYFPDVRYLATLKSIPETTDCRESETGTPTGSGFGCSTSLTCWLCTASGATKENGAILMTGITGLTFATEVSNGFKAVKSKKKIRPKRALRISPYPVMVKVIGADTTEPYC